MKKEKLFKILKQSKESNTVKIGMILSNRIDWGGDNGGMISVKQFDKIAEDLIAFYKLN